MDPNEKFNLIVDGLQEVIGESELINIIKERNLRLYWGTATTGRPHIGYLKPLLKICDFLKAECEVTILFADLHAFLDAMKSDWSHLKYRTQYYEELIKSTLILLDAPIDKLKFVKGTDFQLSTEYTINVYKLMTKLSLHDAIKSGAEVVKQADNPKMASLLYPGLQALDEQFLNIDAQFGGIDQRRIFMMAEKYLPQLGYKKRIHLMSPMIPSLNSNGNKMSCSDIKSKIDLLDSPQTINKKINKAFCEDGNINCGLIKFIEMVLFPILNIKKENFIIDRPKKYGGQIIYEKYIDLENAFLDKKLHPIDLKLGIINWTTKFLKPLRDKFNGTDMNEILTNAY